MKEELLINTGKILMGYYARFFLDFDLLKLEQLPPGPKLFASNHPTTTDPFLIGILSQEPMRIMITGGAFKVPIFKHYLIHAGHIPIHRGKGKGQYIVGQAVENLKNGKAVCIFPEGSLSPIQGGKFTIKPAHSGVGRIALASGAPVIPVGIAVEMDAVSEITGEYSFTGGPATGRWVMKGAYAITVGQAMTFHGDPQNHSVVKDVGDRITEEIRSLAQMSQARVDSHRVQWVSLLNYRNLFVHFLKQLAS